MLNIAVNYYHSMDSKKDSNVGSSETRRVLNLFLGSKINLSHSGILVKLNALERHDKIQRRSICQSICNSLSRRGIDSAPLSSPNYDIAVLGISENELS